MVDKVVEPCFREHDHLIEETIDEFMIHIAAESNDKEDESTNEAGNTGA